MAIVTGFAGSRAGLPVERAAFERLFQAEYSRVVAVAYRVLLDAHDAEDVAQDAFMDVHRRKLSDAPFAAAWLHAAAAHGALNMLRGRRRRLRREELYSQGDVSGVDPQQAVEASASRDLVRGALSRLPRRHSSVLVLRYGGLSYAEVAAALDIRVTHVGTRLRRAEAALRKEIGDAPL